ncbi:MAG: hypothetical protein ACO3JG_08895, partial [Luteolibacter sp.]
METVRATVPEVPDEGAMVEELAVRLEKLVAQPVFEIGGLGTGGGEELAFGPKGSTGILPALRMGRRRCGRDARAPLVGRVQQLAQAVGGFGLAAQRGEADDAVL